MKIATSFLAALLFTGALGSINTAMSADGVISKDELATDSYCHEKFTPMTRQTLDADNPVLSNSGAVIDYYGPCNESPVGEDQIQDQKLEAQHHFTNDDVVLMLVNGVILRGGPRPSSSPSASIVMCQSFR